MGRKKLDPIVRPDAPKELAVKPSWGETYEEALIKSLFEGDELEAEEKEEAIKFTEAQKWVHHERPDEKWDVPIWEKIEYFDPELSYELTGYRPITYDKGLDFDYRPFIEIGQKYEETGKYTEFPIGSKPYRTFWNEQLDRCRNGYTIGDYRLPGDYYFFLNFYRMQKIPDDTTMASGSGRTEGFPEFAVEQYKVCHYLEMCEKLHRDFAILKGRATGLSELVANFAVRPYTTNRAYRTLLTCEADTKLAPLKAKCWKQLNWLDRNTQDGFKHLRQKFNSDDKKRASQVTKDGIEFGWMSEIDSVVADDPQKIRGKFIAV